MSVLHTHMRITRLVIFGVSRFFWRWSLRCQIDLFLFEILPEHIHHTTYWSSRSTPDIRDFWRREGEVGLSRWDNPRSPSCWVFLFDRNYLSRLGIDTRKLSLLDNKDPVWFWSFNEINKNVNGDGKNFIFSSRRWIKIRIFLSLSCLRLNKNYCRSKCLRNLF